MNGERNTSQTRPDLEAERVGAQAEREPKKEPVQHQGRRLSARSRGGTSSPAQASGPTASPSSRLPRAPRAASTPRPRRGEPRRSMAFCAAVSLTWMLGPRRAALGQRVTSARDACLTCVQHDASYLMRRSLLKMSSGTRPQFHCCGPAPISANMAFISRSGVINLAF